MKTISRVLLGWLLLLSALVTVFPVMHPVTADSGGTYYLRVKPDDFRTALREFGEVRLYDVAGVNRRNGTIDVIVPESEFHRLQGEYPLEILATPEERAALTPDPQYKEPAEIDAILHQFHSDYPDITYLISIGQSEEGRDIWAVKISDNAAEDEDEPVVLFNGQHHAREVMASEVPLDTIEYLCSNYGSDPRVTTWVNNLEIWVVPMVNVDGVNWVFHGDDNWRKDRHDNSYPGCPGIDPNRNYPAFWGSCGGSSGYECDITYRGSAPRESSCVDHMVDFAAGIKPVFDISYHSYSEMVIYPYSCDGDLTPEHNLLAGIGQTMAGLIQRDNETMGYDYGTSWQLLYAVDGGDIDWYYANVGTFAYVIELNSDNEGFQPSYSGWRDSTVERLRPAWQYLLDRVSGPAVTGHVRDACTGAPVPGAVVTLDEQPLGSDEDPRLTDGFGRYFRLVNPGEYHVRASASGYKNGGAVVSVGSSQVSQDIYLFPDNAFGLAYVETDVHDGGGDADGFLDPGETAQLEIVLLASGMTTGVAGDLSTGDPYVSIITNHASFGDIPDGMMGSSQAPHFTVSVNPGCPDQHVVNFMLHLTADQTLCADMLQFSVTVSTYEYQCPVYEESLDTDPGYDIDNSGTGGWAYGHPTSGPGGGHTGTNCYGTNLSGNYGNYGDFKLTSTPFDCSEMSGTELYFWRWLSNETNYDTAYVQVSADGTSWTNVWSGYAHDSDWTEQHFDISAIADGQPQVYIRWRLTTDPAITDKGFYIDDIKLCGLTAPANPPTPAPTWTPGPPTATPTVPPTMTPTAAPGEPTFTPAPPTETPSAPPTATPDREFSCYLTLNGTLFTSGDWFQLDVTFYNGFDRGLEVQEYLVLDVYGNYFFYPHWTQDVDYRQRFIEAGAGETETIFAFYWPDTSGSSADDLRFYLGFVDTADMSVLGNIDTVTFGYH